MRLFGDNVWKNERSSGDLERTPTKDSSDVINRLIESVDKAIATSKKVPPNEDDESTIKLEVISLKSGSEDRVSLRGSLRSLPGKTSMSPSTDVLSKDGGNSEVKVAYRNTVLADDSPIPKSYQNGNNNMDKLYTDLRPHTVDTTAGTLVRYLPKLLEKEGDSVLYPTTPATPGSRSRQMASPFIRGISGSAVKDQRFNSLDEKYQNVLPRFYPAVSAHKNRQIEAMRNKKKSGGGHQRLVRFADTHTVRFSNESYTQEPISGLIAHRAPVQSVQRSLDSHSGLFRKQKVQNENEDNNNMV